MKVGQSESFPYPIIADKERTLADKFGMIDPDKRTKDPPLTCRVVRCYRITNQRPVLHFKYRTLYSVPLIY